MKALRGRHLGGLGVVAVALLAPASAVAGKFCYVSHETSITIGGTTVAICEAEACLDSIADALAGGCTTIEVHPDHTEAQTVSVPSQADQVTIRPIDADENEPEGLGRFELQGIVTTGGNLTLMGAKVACHLDGDCDDEADLP